MTGSSTINKSVVIGVDGGQSSTTALVGSLDGRPLGWAASGPIWHIDEPGGQERVKAALTSSIRSALQRAGCPPDRVSVAYLGLTGSTGAAVAVAAVLLPQAKIIVDSDAMAALASGAYGGQGIVVIAGTGSVAGGIGSDGGPVFRGGWGPTLGDDGSGYWIGLSALRAIALADDGIGPATALTSALVGALRLDSVRELFDLVYSGRLDRGAIAALTPLVTGAAEAGDVAATAIINEAVEHLAALVQATAAGVALAGENRRVVLGGGVLAADGPIADALVTELSRRLPGFEIVRPIVPPVVGAYYLALQASGLRLDHEVLRAQAKSEAWPQALRNTSHAGQTTTQEAELP